MNQPRQSWRQKVQSTLDRQAASLDGQTQSQLNQIRNRALAAARPAAAARWLPAGLLAGAAALVLAAGLGLRQATAPFADQVPPEIALLTSDEALDMLEELEFYVWLDETLSDAG